MPVEASQTPQWFPVLCAVIGVVVGFVLNLFREIWVENKQKEKNKSFIKCVIDLNLERLCEFLNQTKEKYGEALKDVHFSFLKETSGESGFLEWSKNFFQGQILHLTLSLDKDDTMRIEKFYKTLETINKNYSKVNDLSCSPYNELEIAISNF